MSIICPYHFTKNVQAGFVSFYKTVTSFGGIICFDFEDSVEQACTNLADDTRKRHREKVLADLQMLAPEIDVRRFGFRINSPDSAWYAGDVAAINSMGSIRCLFLPKIECADTLREILSDIHANVHHIIPIIETEKGFGNLHKILSVKDPRVISIAFGHCDYNFSIGNFPFYHQDSPVYWQWVQKLASQCAAHNLSLINSPVLKLNDDDLFLQNLSRLAHYKNISGQITLCMQQTILCRTGSTPVFAENSFSVTDKNVREIAEEMILGFASYKVQGKTFAVNDRRILISPQEYKAAQLQVQ